ncbi:MAG: DUF6089 family protein [Bacteroidales bacterium]|jgi:hypothetical protein|nr:DUF6089 family protein [Bacteroidales bacterium]MDD4214265.1 DUF6089 family protein [Bacteroidales bacterium]
MKKVFLVGILFLVLRSVIIAQDFYRSELGVFIGTSYYLGDLNPSKHFLQSKLAYGIVYRYNITPRWALKVNAFLGKLEGDDAVSKANEDRNLRFRSHIFDFSTQIEFNFLPYITGDKQRLISPYIFVGASLFNFNPKAELDEKLYSLQALGTEGQGTTIPDTKKPYALTAFAIPFGIGVKVSPHRILSIGLEWGIRKTFSDYIDDVSTIYVDSTILAAENTLAAAQLADRSLTNRGQHAGMERGNPKTKDWYVFTGLTVSFRIKGKHDLCAAYKQHPKIKFKYKD